MPPKNRDPKKPKGRTSAYAFFVKKRRQTYLEEQKPIDFKGFGQECSVLWREITKEDKSVFEEQAMRDKVRYDAEMKHYTPPADATGKGRGRARKKKDPNMPKRPLSAFIIFCQEKRPLLKEQNPGLSVGDIAKELGKAWQVMSTDQKEPYEKKARKDRERYEEQKEEYRKEQESHHNDIDDEEEEEEDESD